jgi:hypothetical protein
MVYQTLTVGFGGWGLGCGVQGVGRRTHGVPVFGSAVVWGLVLEVSVVGSRV